MHREGYNNDAEIEKMFASFDVNHDNTISLEEKQAAIQSLKTNSKKAPQPPPKSGVYSQKSMLSCTFMLVVSDCVYL